MISFCQKLFFDFFGLNLENSAELKNFEKCCCFVDDNNFEFLFDPSIHRAIVGAFLGLSDKPVEEGSVGEETVLVLGVSQLLEELLGILLGDEVT